MTDTKPKKISIVIHANDFKFVSMTGREYPCIQYTRTLNKDGIKIAKREIMTSVSVELEINTGRTKNCPKIDLSDIVKGLELITDTSATDPVLIKTPHVDITVYFVQPDNPDYDKY